MRKQNNQTNKQKHKHTLGPLLDSALNDVLHVVGGGLGGHVDGQHAVGLWVQLGADALGHRGLTGAHGPHQEDRLLPLDQRLDDEVVAHRVHRRHHDLVEGSAAMRIKYEN